MPHLIMRAAEEGVANSSNKSYKRRINRRKEMRACPSAQVRYLDIPCNSGVNLEWQSF